MDAVKTMHVVKVTDPNHEAYDQYYGGFNKAAERPYYVKKLSKAKWYSNPRDIFLRDCESVVTINFGVAEEQVQEQKGPSRGMYKDPILTSTGISLTAFSAQVRH